MQAVEEELALKRQMLQGKPGVDTWGCRGMDGTAGVIAGGLFLTQVAITSQETLLVGGAGGVQRSLDAGAPLCVCVCVCVPQWCAMNLIHCNIPCLVMHFFNKTYRNVVVLGLFQSMACTLHVLVWKIGPRSCMCSKIACLTCVCKRTSCHVW